MMDPYSALCVWSLFLVVACFLLGKRCGYMDEKARCIAIIRDSIAEDRGISEALDDIRNCK